MPLSPATGIPGPWQGWVRRFENSAHRSARRAGEVLFHGPGNHRVSTPSPWHVPCSCQDKRAGPKSPPKGDVMTEQETKGQVKQVKGRIKEAVGIVTGDKHLEKEGSHDRAVGGIQEAAGKAVRKVGEAVENLADAIKK